MNTVHSTIGSMKRRWGWMLAFGILLVLTGIFAIMDPLATGLAVSAILFASFLIAGIASLVAAFQDGGWQAKIVDILFGILALLTAFICLSNPFGSAISVVWVAGIFFIVNGIIELANGFKADTDKGLMILLGVIDLLLGFYVAFVMGPLAALATLAFMVGLGFIFRGILLSVLAFRIRSVTSKLPS